LELHEAQVPVRTVGRALLCCQEALTESLAAENSRKRRACLTRVGDHTGLGLWFVDPDGMRGEVALIVDPSLSKIHEPRPIN
jgi:hypothetical protein